MNIVFAFADDWGRYTSAYAEYEGGSSINSVISTPNIEWVAKEGAMFTNAFVPAPSCTPCRSSVLSGMYFWQTGLGAILNGAYWDESIRTYPLELEKSGYHIGYTYKVWAPGENPNAPYGGERTQYYVGDEPAMGIRKFGKFSKFSQSATKLAETYGVEQAKEMIFDETRQSFKSFLKDRKEGQPFCYWWGPTNTHRAWELGSGKKLWGIDPDSLKGKMPKCLPDVPEIREDFSDYLGEAMAFDGGVGVLIEELRNIGELDNTLIVVSGDHGIPGMPRGKCNLYDLGTQVALLMRWSNHIQRGTQIDDMVNLMDLAPTFLDAAGVEIPDTMAGHSLIPLVTGKKDDVEREFVVTGRERHVAVAREGNLPYPQRAIRTKDYLYIINFEPDRWPMGSPKDLDNITYDQLLHNTRIAYADLDASPTKAWICTNRKKEDVEPLYRLGFDKRPYEELYDLRCDHDNMVNVAGKPEYEGIKKELNEKLMKVLVEEKDPRVVEKPCRYENAPYTTRQ